MPFSLNMKRTIITTRQSVHSSPVPMIFFYVYFFLLKIGALFPEIVNENNDVVVEEKLFKKKKQHSDDSSKIDLFVLNNDGNHYIVPWALETLIFIPIIPYTKIKLNGE